MIHVSISSAACRLTQTDSLEAEEAGGAEGLG